MTVNVPSDVQPVSLLAFPILAQASPQSKFFQNIQSIKEKSFANTRETTKEVMHFHLICAELHRALLKRGIAFYVTEHIMAWLPATSECMNRVSTETRRNQWLTTSSMETCSCLLLCANWMLKSQTMFIFHVCVFTLVLSSSQWPHLSFFAQKY